MGLINSPLVFQVNDQAKQKFCESFLVKVSEMANLISDRLKHLTYGSF